MSVELLGKTVARFGETVAQLVMLQKLVLLIRQKLWYDFA